MTEKSKATSDTSAGPSDDGFSQRLAAAMNKTTNGEARAAASDDGAGENVAQDQAATEVQNLPETGPLGEGEHVVANGECIASIAWENGHLAETIWDDPANRELRAARLDPNVLRRGDRVHVPARQRKEEPGATEQRHRFRRKGIEQLRLVLRVEGDPRAEEPYKLHIEGLEQTGTTDAEGRITIRIPPNARRGKLTLINGGEEFDLELGDLDPLTEYSGVQARLHNLGYEVDVGGEWDDKSAAALRQFQRRHELQPTGKIDEATREMLREVYGC